MLRSFALGLTVLVAACFGGSEPAGTVPVEARFTNRTGQALTLSVRSATGEIIPSAVQPIDVVPALSTVTVTVYVPTAGDWSIRIGDWGEIPRDDVRRDLQRGCGLVAEVNPDGSGMYGCDDQGG